MPKSRRAKKLLYLAYAAVIALGVFLATRPLTFQKIDTGRTDEAVYAETPSTATGVASTTRETPGSPKDEPSTVPILVYHIVRPAYPDDSAEVKKLAQTPEVFDAELAYLAAAGYQVVPLAALVSHIASGTPLAAHPIVITFDDGWRDQFEYAFPILKRQHVTATFFIFTNAVGHRAFVSWDNLREMRDAGMTIESHSRSHPFLTKIADSAKLWDEIYGSKQIIEKNLGISVTEFAYPFGQYDATTTALVKKAGYRAARGDIVNKHISQSRANLYILSALNAPVTLDHFERVFPAFATTTPR